MNVAVEPVRLIFFKSKFVERVIKRNFLNLSNKKSEEPRFEYQYLAIIKRNQLTSEQNRQYGLPIGK